MSDATKRDEKADLDATLEQFRQRSAALQRMKTVRAKRMRGSGKTLNKQLLAAAEKKHGGRAWHLEGLCQTLGDAEAHRAGKTAHETHERFEAGTFKTLAAVANRIRKLEGLPPQGGVSLQFYIGSLTGSDEQSLSYFEHVGKHALYGIRRVSAN
jgi:hypothetical protein